jgi:Lrp/AsnC family transcriptional regulator, regulator for asnA, asnC and gidA
MARRRSQHGEDALDDIDRAIMARLQVDGRLPYSKLAPAVGLSEAAVRERV